MKRRASVCQCVSLRGCVSTAGSPRDFILIMGRLRWFANGFPTARVMNCLKVFTARASVTQTYTKTDTSAFAHEHSSLPAVLTRRSHARADTRSPIKAHFLFCCEVQHSKEQQEGFWFDFFFFVIFILPTQIWRTGEAGSDSSLCSGAGHAPHFNIWPAVNGAFQSPLAVRLSIVLPPAFPSSWSLCWLQRNLETSFTPSQIHRFGNQQSGLLLISLHVHNLLVCQMGFPTLKKQLRFATCCTKAATQGKLCGRSFPSF